MTEDAFGLEEAAALFEEAGFCISIHGRFEAGVAAPEALTILGFRSLLGWGYILRTGARPTMFPVLYHWRTRGRATVEALRDKLSPYLSEEKLGYLDSLLSETSG